MEETDNYASEIERLKGLINEGSSGGDTMTSLAQAAPSVRESTMPVSVSSARKATEGADTAKKPVNVATGPVGLDIGTSHLVSALRKGESVRATKQLNAFFTIPSSNFTKEILLQNEIMFFEHEGKFFINGFSAEGFANMFNTNTRRSIERGILSPREIDGFLVIKALIGAVVGRPAKFGETICFGIPGQPIDSSASIIYHEIVLKRFLGTLGFTPISINEGMAVVMSELAANNYTGIGVSMGGGMCNVCLSYLSVPVITYSIQKAGDYIDQMAGEAIGEPATKVKGVKENTLDLTKDSSDRILNALNIFYDDLIASLLQSMQEVFNASNRVPKIDQPVPIVLSGGSALPLGVKEKFQKAMKSYRFPFKVSNVDIAEEPLTSIAKGALIMAETERI